MLTKFYYCLRSNGDGSATPVFFESKELALDLGAQNE